VGSEDSAYGVPAQIETLVLFTRSGRDFNVRVGQRKRQGSESGIEDTMNEEKIQFLVLFCALILAKKQQAPIQESMKILPENAKAKQLATNLVYAS
jgi:hypothetical protein